MGVEIWQLRTTPITSPFALVIVIEELNDKRQEKLLKKMLASLELSETEIKLVSVDQFMKNKSLTANNILVLGEKIGQRLLNVEMPLEELRNKTHYYNNIPLRISFHPADLLRLPLNKKKAYQDLRLGV